MAVEPALGALLLGLAHPIGVTGFTALTAVDLGAALNGVVASDVAKDAVNGGLGSH